jgi:hypothetical protein
MPAEKRSRKQLEAVKQFEVVKSGLYNWLRVMHKRRSAVIRGDPESMALDLRLRKTMHEKQTDLVLVIAQPENGHFFSICEDSEEKTIETFMQQNLTFSDLHLASLLIE